MGIYSACSDVCLIMESRGRGTAGGGAQEVAGKKKGHCDPNLRKGMTLDSFVEFWVGIK